MTEETLLQKELRITRLRKTRAESGRKRYMDKVQRLEADLLKAQMYKLEEVSNEELLAEIARRMKGVN